MECYKCLQWENKLWPLSTLSLQFFHRTSLWTVFSVRDSSYFSHLVQESHPIFTTALSPLGVENILHPTLCWVGKGGRVMRREDSGDEGILTRNSISGHVIRSLAACVIWTVTTVILLVKKKLCPYSRYPHSYNVCLCYLQVYSLL